MTISFQCSTTQHWNDSRNNQKGEQYHCSQEHNARMSGVFTNGTVWACPGISGNHDHKRDHGSQQTLGNTSNHNWVQASFHTASAMRTTA